MPRKARIDAPGALQHIIGRGIERRKIFWADKFRSGTDKTENDNVEMSFVKIYLRLPALRIPP